ncbi:hypothetical protein N5F23_15110 [Pseudomonas sichuanensis]|uniref:hypothetical protein n=1 Tax=Pseudomonas sichuanensis TaxID=2213015 RepID=UPI0024470D9C|nr:hypothetical protein [Pseudomonas sichuanensis]MDH0731827.1 hypothetical protein [Pseudomonas sichuanensis]MDH1583907.1 hypothetical protein [Pseudomonas sichuanensis]MDH1592419.1 hypothetical protein [Pseudomonas sichuanensis]MDH1598170.1 hypothetical protein [Pseudomonas sichuanensis]
MSPSMPPATDAGLQQFLDEEVTAAALAHLLQKAQAARSNRLVEAFSGNAYQVAFKDDVVLIEHHYVKEWPAVRVSLARFIEALQARKEQLGA